MDNERLQLLDHVKKMKEREIQLVNDFNDNEQKLAFSHFRYSITLFRIRMQRLKLEIDEAIKTSAVDV